MTDIRPLDEIVNGALSEGFATIFNTLALEPPLSKALMVTTVVVAGFFLISGFFLIYRSKAKLSMKVVMATVPMVLLIAGGREFLKSVPMSDRIERDLQMNGAHAAEGAFIDRSNTTNAQTIEIDGHLFELSEEDYPGLSRLEPDVTASLQRQCVKAIYTRSNVIVWLGARRGDCKPQGSPVP